ncbi:hypothetical protein PCIT_a2531 [Pseudoalteromonas citrea]|uniref:Uncharacterized protein n=2 Tax=Pseudoalteromonas citrea TaxID=43655 RepID=A0AAD4AH70_9GAMM|nr:hypothetical protein [Pseudoalteromonas citrea]KAF7769662.1 hypothetical protein PCIT_a2531 [Pseudoalteromonas citrea]
MTTLSYIAHVNVTGTALSALYSAVQNAMLFAKPSATYIRYDDSLDAPYIVAELAPLQGLGRASRIVQMLSFLCDSIEFSPLIEGKSRFGLECITHIHFVLPCDDTGQPVVDISALEQLLLSYLPKQQLSVTQSSSLSLAQLPENALIMAADSCVGADVATLPVFEQALQVVDGPVGITLSEGACAFLNSPLTTPNHTIKYELYNGTLAQQLVQSGAKSTDQFIFIGQMSERWLKQWYGQSHALYQADEPVIQLTDMSNTLGYVEQAQSLMGLTYAHATLQCPLYRAPQVWLVNNVPTPSLIKVSRSD